MNAVREAIVVTGRRWIGTPFRHQASLRGVGCDCIGLITGVARELGFESAERFGNDQRFRGYAKQPEPTMLKAAVSEYLDPVDLADVQPGDILLLRYKREPQHFALRVERDGLPYMVHGYGPKEVVENRIDEKWRGRIVGAYKYREVP